MLLNRPDIEKNILHKSHILLNLIDYGMNSVRSSVLIKKRLSLNNHFIIFDKKTYNFNKLYVAAIGKASEYMIPESYQKYSNASLIISGRQYSTSGMGNVIVAGHPTPDENSIIASDELEKMIHSMGEDDLLLLLISGGASAMLGDFYPSLKVMRQLTSTLMEAGADIYELNTIRKHLSMFKGGKLLKLVRGKILALFISDVVGDDLGTIASGLTYYDESTFSDALNIFMKYNLKDEFPEVYDRLSNPEKYGMKETLKKDEFFNYEVDNVIICNNNTILKNIENRANDLGYSAVNLGTIVKGESRLASKNLLKRFKDLNDCDIMITGGETVVHVTGSGIGGRNQEFVLSLMEDIELNDMSVISVGTDGIDGSTDAAGAVADRKTCENARTLSLNASEFLKNNDSYHFFKKTGTLIKTGATETNVMDVQIFLKTKRNC